MWEKCSCHESQLSLSRPFAEKIQEKVQMLNPWIELRTVTCRRSRSKDPHATVQTSQLKVSVWKLCCSVGNDPEKKPDWSALTGPNRHRPQCFMLLSIPTSVNNCPSTAFKYRVCVVKCAVKIHSCHRCVRRNPVARINVCHHVSVRFDLKFLFCR